MPRRKYASHQRRSAAGQVMKRESIEKRIKTYFKLEGSACASALSEVQDCFESSVYLDAILQEVGSSAATKEEAIVKWAIIRGEQWVGMSFLPGPTYSSREIGVSLSPPMKVRTLQAALHTKAKNSPNYRF